jgi:mono/diheme cytochrome c family protein
VRWFAIGLGAAAGLVLLGMGWVYFRSETVRAKVWPMPEAAFHVPRDSTVADGAHLAKTLGCVDCHGARLEGQYMDFIPGSTVYSRNLPALAGTYTDADFERVIRRALKPDGRSVMIMPSNQYAGLTDRETGSLIAYIRSIKSNLPQVPDLQYGLMVRVAIMQGMFPTEATARRDYKPPLDLGPGLSTGRHIAMTSCAECHTSTLAGHNGPPVQSPDLAIVASYERPDFIRFMRTGKAAGNRELPLMSAVARARFSHFSDIEVNALYDYLVARGQKLVAQ